MGCRVGEDSSDADVIGRRERRWGLNRGGAAETGSLDDEHQG